jgi:hypothetical protein
MPLANSPQTLVNTPDVPMEQTAALLTGATPTGSAGGSSSQAEPAPAKVDSSALGKPMDIESLAESILTGAYATFESRIQGLEHDLAAAKRALASLGKVTHSGQGHGGWFRKWLDATFGAEPEPAVPEGEVPSSPAGPMAQSVMSGSQLSESLQAPPGGRPSPSEGSK